jgi:hypothetical protein
MAGLFTRSLILTAGLSMAACASRDKGILHVDAPQCLPTPTPDQLRACDAAPDGQKFSCVTSQYVDMSAVRTLAQNSIPVVATKVEVNASVPLMGDAQLSEDVRVEISDRRRPFNLVKTKPGAVDRDGDGKFAADELDAEKRADVLSLSLLGLCKNDPARAKRFLRSQLNPAGMESMEQMLAVIQEGTFIPELGASFTLNPDHGPGQISAREIRRMAYQGTEGEGDNLSKWIGKALNQRQHRTAIPAVFLLLADLILNRWLRRRREVPQNKKVEALFDAAMAESSRAARPLSLREIKTLRKQFERGVYGSWMRRGAMSMGEIAAFGGAWHLISSYLTFWEWPLAELSIQMGVMAALSVVWDRTINSRRHPVKRAEKELLAGKYHWAEPLPADGKVVHGLFDGRAMFEAGLSEELGVGESLRKTG